MLTPKQIEDTIKTLTDVYERMEDDLLSDVVGHFDALDPNGGSEKWRFEKLAELGAVRRGNVKTIAASTGKSESQVREVLKKLGLKTLETDEPIYQQAFSKGILKAAPLPADAAPNILRVIESSTGRMNEYLNLVNTTALQSTNKAYTDIINQTYLEAATGISTYTEALTKAVRQLADQSITGADYTSKNGKHTRNNIDVAVRRGIMTASSQMTGEIQTTRAKE